jgi:hypothetical protein
MGKGVFRGGFVGERGEGMGGIELKESLVVGKDGGLDGL